MKLAGEYTFDGPQEEVWRIIRDPEVLATALPGTQSLEQVSENEYRGEMNVRVGPVAGEFSGKINVSNEVPPESCTLIVEGRGKPGFINGTGHIRLSPEAGGKTLMNYEGEMQIGGKLASVGQRLLDSASKSIISQGLDTLNAALQARLAAQASGQAVEFTAPSEAQFAASVAKDMAGQVFSPSRLIWIAIVVVIIVIIIAILLSRGA